MVPEDFRALSVLCSYSCGGGEDARESSSFMFRNGFQKGLVKRQEDIVYS